MSRAAMADFALTADDRELADGVRAGTRRALAKAITLIESIKPEHQARAEALLDVLLPETGKAFRVGITGVPGVGKSTFIEALGLHLIEQGHRVAVLAVDPSSSVTGGSILGDKTRMEKLSQDERAFIRPSPSSGSLGGVAEKTREALLLCEAAGFDIIIVETVGVGQSETAVAGMTDCFVLLQLPNAGDDLQAIKKGVVELADIVVFNKADIDAVAAERAAAQMKAALTMLRPSSSHWQPPVLTVSALSRAPTGISSGHATADFWETLTRYRQVMTDAGELAAKRREQAKAWLWQLIDSGLRQRFRHHPAIKAALPELTRAVEAGATTPAAAARKLLTLPEHDYDKLQFD
jgi:LAO/AO transport system kinase